MMLFSYAISRCEAGDTEAIAKEARINELQKRIEQQMEEAEFTKPRSIFRKHVFGEQGYVTVQIMGMARRLESRCMELSALR